MIYLAFYKGKSWISKAIRWQTFGEYSHVGTILEDGSIIEAWHVGGVLRNPTISSVHTPGTVVDIYSIAKIGEIESAEIFKFLSEQVGRKYDFRGVLRFLTRQMIMADPNTDKWFCSELVAESFKHVGFPLLNPEVPSMRYSPTVLSYSPLLTKIKTVTTK